MEPIGKKMGDPEQFSKHLTVSAVTSAKRIEKATTYARILLGCYRTSEVPDPEVFTAAATAILAKFPDQIARTVCDPVIGLPSRLKWFPTISEIMDACNQEQIRQETIERYEAMGATQQHTGPHKKLPPKIGDGGPGTIYTSSGFHDAIKNHGRPFGPSDSGRQLPYNAD